MGKMYRRLLLWAFSLAVVTLLGVVAWGKLSATAAPLQVSTNKTTYASSLPGFSFSLSSGNTTG